MNNRIVFVAVSIVVIALTRFLPHPHNVTPIAAMALFGGAMLPNRFYAFLLPMAAMLLSDLFIGFHSTMWAVYFSFALTVLIGFMVKNTESPFRIAGASITSSIIFFLITNFAVWYGEQVGPVIYPRNETGLVMCYEAGLPFFRNSLLGDLFFNAVLFGAFGFAKAKYPKLARA